MRRTLETNESSIFGMADIEYCKITSDTADVKAGIGIDFDTIMILKKDDVVRVLRQVDDQYVVQLDNNQIGSIDTVDATPIVREGETQQQQQTTPDREPQTTEPVPHPQIGEDTPPPEDPFIQPETEEEASPQQQPPAEAPRTQIATEPPADSPIQGLTSLEEQMFHLVNRERERNNLPALAIDLEVTRVARIKSQDMVDHDYFSHYSPTYGSPFEMLDSFGIKYLHAGENLAGNSSVDAAHTSLMNSSGHRKNILSPDFTHIGIGVRSSNRYGQIFTQMFISKPQ